MSAAAGSGEWLQPSDTGTDLALTLPVFVLYHLGVVFLPVQNAADWVTRRLVGLVHHDTLAYVAVTLTLGAIYLSILVLFGKAGRLRWRAFVALLVEAFAYAIAMRLVAGYVVGSLLLSGGGRGGAFTGFIMSLGAGLYEELMFRVVLFGFGSSVLASLVKPRKWLDRWVLAVVWAGVASAVFSAWHHLGALGDPFVLSVFVFRLVCGLVFTAIYAARGFAPAVWTHILYDLWVLVL